MARKGKSTVKSDAPMEQDSWRAQDDLRTLSRADEISRDKKRLSAARAEAQKQMASLSKVAGDRGSKKSGSGESSQARRKRLEKVQL